MKTSNIKVNESRICEEFCQMVSMDSVSFHEREMADLLTVKLQQLGFQVSEDDAGAYYHGNAGNLYGFLKGTLPGKPLLLSAHMDTVTPGKGKKAIFCEDGTITSDRTTVLGADDVNGIAGILEGIRAVEEAGIPHRDIEVVFSIAEELYCKGAEVLDYDKIQAEDAYILDMSGAPGMAAIQAPSIISFHLTVQGKAAHAGFCPEQGIHAIQIMSRAVSKLQQGHLDEDTTLNIGMITGGEATNIVPESCTCHGEIRSYNHEKALLCVEHVRTVFDEVLKDTGASLKMDVEIHVQAYRTEESAAVVRRFQAACEDLELPAGITKTFGGSDNNKFALHGIHGIVLSCGMNHVHSIDEYTSVRELVLCAALVSQLITSEI